MALIGCNGRAGPSWMALVGASLCIWALPRCSQPPRPQSIALPHTDAGGGADCPATSLTVGAACCPAGWVALPAPATCAAVGPRGCATAAATGSLCSQKWCWDLRDVNGGPCAALGLGCFAAPRACTDSEVAAGAGCPVGEWPASEVGGGCRPAGPYSADPAADATSAAATPRWCGRWLDPGGAACDAVDDRCTLVEHLCSDAELAEGHACLAGQFADPVAPHKCRAAGADWLCPAGFAEQANPSGGLPVCRPDPALCPPDGTPPKAAPSAIFVAQGAPAGGNGSAQKPFADLAQALLNADGAAEIVLLPGKYATKGVLAISVKLRGVCAAKVELDAAFAQGPAVVDVSGVQFGKGGRIAAVDGGTIRATNVWVPNPFGAAFAAVGANSLVEVKNSVAENAMPSPVLGGVGVGAFATEAATLRLDGVRIGSFAGQGLLASMPGTVMQARNLGIDGLRSKAGTYAGRAISAFDGATIAVSGASITGIDAAPAVVTGSGTVATLVGLSVELTRQNDDGQSPGGLFVNAGGSLRLLGTAISGATSQALEVDGDGTTALVVGSVLAGTRALAASAGAFAGRWGGGIMVNFGGWARVESSLFAANEEANWRVAFGTLLARDSAMFGASAGHPAPTAARGLVAIGQSLVVLRGVRMTNLATAGVLAVDALTRVEGLGVAIAQTRSNQSGSFGGGLSASGGSAIACAGCAVVGNRSYGAGVVGSNSRLSLGGTVVADTLPVLENSGLGQGLVVGGEATLQLDACLVTGNRSAGVLVAAQGNAAIRDSQVRQTAFLQVSNEHNHKAEFADGIVADGAARVMVARTALHGHQRAAFFVATGEATVENCSMTDSLFGVVVGPGAKLMETVNWVAGNSAANRSGDAGLQVPPMPKLANAPK